MDTDAMNIKAWAQGLGLPESNVVFLKTTDSTNSFIRSIPDGDDKSWMLVVADYQTAGRGSAGNHWESEPGKNLLFSLRTHPHTVSPAEIFILSEVMALCVRSAIAGDNSRFTVKWPNDIYYDDGKVAGMLIENELTGDKVKSSIAGVGVNVNQTLFLSDAPNPISLAQINRKPADRMELLGRILTSLRVYYNKVERRQYEDIHAEYLSHLYRRTGVFPFRDTLGTFMASIAEVRRDGHIVLRDSSGQLRTYGFKEVEYI